MKETACSHLLHHFEPELREMYEGCPTYHPYAAEGHGNQKGLTITSVASPAKLPSSGGGYASFYQSTCAH